MNLPGRASYISLSQSYMDKTNVDTNQSSKGFWCSERQADYPTSRLIRLSVRLMPRPHIVQAKDGPS